MGDKVTRRMGALTALLAITGSVFIGLGVYIHIHYLPPVFIQIERFQ